MHRFLTGREAGSSTDAIKPVYGLTAAILIRVAIVGYARMPAFEVYAPGQGSSDIQRRTENAVRWSPVFKEARWKEYIVCPGEEEEWEEWRKRNGVTRPPKVKGRGRGFLARSRL